MLLEPAFERAEKVLLINAILLKKRELLSPLNDCFFQTLLRRGIKPEGSLIFVLVAISILNSDLGFTTAEHPAQSQNGRLLESLSRGKVGMDLAQNIFTIGKKTAMPVRDSIQENSLF